MKKKQCLLLLFLLCLFVGVCSACSNNGEDSIPPSTGQPTPSEEEKTSAETPTETNTVSETETAAPQSTSIAVIIPAPEMGSKPRLSELPDSELMKYMLEQKVDFGAVPDPANDEKTITQTRGEVCEIEADPYGFMAHADYTAIGMAAESVRRAVCRYYEWPLVRLVAEFTTDAGRIIPELQMWSLQENFFGRRASTTETGVKMLFVAPSVSPQGDGFRRKMTVYLEPADVISEKERAEAPDNLMKSGLGEGIFPKGTAVVYDLGNHAYDVYLYLEGGRSAVKIEASLTEEELKDMLQNCRFFETAG